MSTVVANVLSDLNDARCYISDLSLGAGKAWVTININTGTLTLNTAHNISSVQDLGVALYKGVQSISLPGDNGSRAVSVGHARDLVVTSFGYQGAMYDGTTGSSGIRMSIDAEANPTFVHGVIY
jgi:hypothetical protein